MKLPYSPYKKEFDEYSKHELISLLKAFEEQTKEKNDCIKDTRSRLMRARIRLQTKDLQLQHLRKRVVELTSPISVSDPFR